ncbi:molybdopterin converting factor subunit 1 [Rubrobacter tropicus]|uniref:Molybdopterin synthase sulfur carrier subunit n=1 Tax=Rubrobacter tropicus TaxID=2653851 RepID=A0A6G8Q5R8_9ACTN|nr:molybdopterin converting factor subunit 1 [Rubrobacter tropicus]QIN81769.1 molybdopterin converting factor subunit 1 [Rubrobacter tropicus]
MIEVLLFGAAADRAGTRTVRLDVKEASTLAAIWPLLADRYPDLASMRDTLAFAVNGEYAKMDGRVEPGDEVAVLPPVSGG